MVKSFGKAFHGALLCLAIVGTSVTAAAPALAQAASDAPVFIATHRDWHAFQFTEDGKKACYIASRPTQLEPSSVNHGDVYILVTDRPAERKLNVVSVQVGYDFKSSSEVSVTVGSQSFQLFTVNNSAWSRDDAGDASLVAAMKNGSSMTVKGTSQRGTNVTYTFSLLGITAALGEIEKACGV